MSQIHIENTTNNTSLTPQKINRSSGSLSNHKRKAQIHTWENMFNNFYHFFQKKQKKNPYLIQSNTVSKVEQSPIENISPFPLVNKFRDHPKLKYSFKMYISGQKSAEQLLQECNRIKTVPKPKNGNGEPVKKSHFKFFNLLGINEEQFASKVRAQKRLDKIRNLVQSKINEKEKQNIQDNYQDCGFIKYAINACEDYEQKIRQGNLNGSQISGKYKRYQGGVRWNDTSYNKRQSESCKQLKSDTRILKFATQSEVQQHADEYLNLQVNRQYLEDQKQKRQVKLNIVHNRKQQLEQLFQSHTNKFYEFNSGKQKEPSLKDIELYMYLHKAKWSGERGKEGEKEEGKRLKHNQRRSETQVREEVNSHDSSLCSELENRLDYLYEASAKAQKRVREEGRQGLARQVRNVQRVEALRAAIQKANLEKLYFQRRVE